MNEKYLFGGSKNPVNFFRALAYDIKFMRANPDYFEPSGIYVFVGCQGTGKSLSAVLTVKNILKEYPKAKLCTNIEIHGLPDTVEVIPFVDAGQIGILDNGIEGIVFLIDEIQTVWNSLESRNIPVSEIAELAQNRKSRRVIIGTSQVYGRMAKPVREQLKYVIKCRTLLKYIQINEVIDPNAEGYTGDDDGHAEGEVIRKTFFFHKPEYYESYDTFVKIKRKERVVKT